MEYLNGALDRTNENTQNVVVLSVGDAHELTGKTKDRSELIKIANEVIKREEITGSADEYHNLAVTYTRDWDDYSTGYAIVKKGLSQYPANIDLLADAIYYGSYAGKYEECEQHVEALSRTPLAMWNWRAFTFLIDYFVDKLDWIPWQTTEDSEVEKILQELLDKALRFAKLEQRILFGSGEAERGYLAENKVRLLREKALRARSNLLELQEDPDQELIQKLLREAEEEHRKAEDILQVAIDNGQFAACTCCIRLADILFERQEYERTIEVCEKALTYAESQPSANTAYFIYLIALSRDALIHRDKCYSNPERIEEAYHDYGCAYRLNSVGNRRPVYLDNIRNRLAILEVKSGIEAPELDEKKGEIDAAALQKLLDNL